MPIVPNFILKLEEDAKIKENKTEESVYYKICKNRTVIDDSYTESRLGFKGSPASKRSSGNSGNQVQWNESNYDARPPLECESFLNKTADKIQKDEKQRKEYEEYGDANVKAGIMFGSKALVQMLFNPFVGPITNRLLLFCLIV